MKGIKNFFAELWFYVLTCFEKYFDFSGRARRKEYWYFKLSIATVGNLLYCFFPLFAIVFSILVVIPSLAVGFRRAHDIGYSGTWVLLGDSIITHSRWSARLTDRMMATRFPNTTSTGAIPIFAYITIIVFIYFFTKDSQTGENKWGANPKDLA